MRAIYAAIVALPLLAASEREVRRFGGLILASVIASALFFGYAFVSVWCFFAAVLSAYLALRLRVRLTGTHERPGQRPRSRGGGHWRPLGA